LVKSYVYIVKYLWNGETAEGGVGVGGGGGMGGGGVFTEDGAKVFFKLLLNRKFSVKSNKICSLSNCFGWSSVCFGSIETSKLSVSV
jgi:hypothetical protein